MVSLQEAFWSAQAQHVEALSQLSKSPAARLANEDSPFSDYLATARRLRCLNSFHVNFGRVAVSTSSCP